MSSRRDRGMERFEQELRRWGSRPPLTPPEEAGRRIAARLKPYRSGLPVWQMAAAAAAVVLLVCGSWVGLHFTGGTAPHPLEPGAARSAEFVPPPLEENVVLWWLDDETPVYFVLGTGDAG